jgi:hypothetical protein
VLSTAAEVPESPASTVGAVTDVAVPLEAAVNPVLLVAKRVRSRDDVAGTAFQLPSMPAAPV